MPAMPDFQPYAELIVHVGLNLQPGQRLFIGPLTPPAAAPLAHAVAAAAYAAGARWVDAAWDDPQLARLRVQHAPDAALDEYPAWVGAAISEYVSRGDAFLTLAGEDPDLMRGLDPARVGRAQQARTRGRRALLEAATRNQMNWVVAAHPTAAWAAKALPDLPAEQGVAELWRLIGAACRLDRPDPVGAWRAHVADLTARAGYLTARRYTALHYEAPGTNLVLGLPPGHIWRGGQLAAANGVSFTPNLPTEEVFTLPDRARAEGTVRATLPLSYGGSLIQDFVMRFAEGRVVDVRAEHGEAVLSKVIETDQGSARLGEAALVAASSPVAAAGRLFYNTLFDENAACHLALGQSYRFTLHGGEALSPEAFQAAGGNLSAAHVDFMIGSPAMDVYGVCEDGVEEPLMKQGEWTFKAGA
ncbi:MAG: aminopeptidase [Anaerolineales bacterium]|nr:aminopeptidase [Anaerolineales bacterium]